MNDRCKGCGAGRGCTAYEACLCCGKCRNCGEAHGVTLAPAQIPQQPYYPPTLNPPGYPWYEVQWWSTQTVTDPQMLAKFQNAAGGVGAPMYWATTRGST